MSRFIVLSVVYAFAWTLRAHTHCSLFPKKGVLQNTCAEASLINRRRFSVCFLQATGCGVTPHSIDNTSLFVVYNTAIVIVFSFGMLYSTYTDISCNYHTIIVSPP